MLFHRHEPKCTGRRISAAFGKLNLPEGKTPVHSAGDEAICAKCGVRLIVHDPRLKMACWYTELEDVA